MVPAMIPTKISTIKPAKDSSLPSALSVPLFVGYRSQDVFLARTCQLLRLEGNPLCSSSSKLPLLDGNQLCFSSKPVLDSILPW